MGCLFAPYSALSQDRSGPARSDGPIIEVVVVGPGDNFYTIFGHLAVLVRSNADVPPAQGDLFNFGVTKFSDPLYLWNFMTGRAIFWGNKRPYQRQLKKWSREDRSIRRYPLLLNSKVRQEIHDRFEEMVSPAGREFRYDTFRENCSTRVRDVIDEFTDGAIGARWKQRRTQETFRDRARHGYAQHPALLGLLDWGAGEVMDAPRTAWQRAGEPVFFGAELPTLTTQDGGPLFGKETVDRSRKGGPAVGGSTSWLTYLHAIIALFLFFLGMTWRGEPNRLKGGTLLVWSLGVTFVGLLFYILHFVSLWPETRANWLMLGACPLDIVLLGPAIAWLRGSTDLSPWVIGYLRFRVCVFVAGLCVEPFIAPEMGPVGPRMLLLCGWFLVNRLIDDASQVATAQSSPS